MDSEQTKPSLKRVTAISMALPIFDLRGEGAIAVNIWEVIRVFEKFGVGERMKYKIPNFPISGRFGTISTFFYAQPEYRLGEVEGPMDRIFDGLGQVIDHLIWLAMRFASCVPHTTCPSEDPF